MKKLIIIGVILSLLGVMVLVDSTDLFANKVYAEGNGEISNVKIVSVQGSGEVKVKPDVAYIKIGVETKNKNASDAQVENKEIMDKVTLAIKEFVNDASDIQTAQYNIYKNYNYNDSSKEKDEYYVVSNTLSVTLKNIENVGKVIDEATKLGANKVNNISFGILDEQKYYNMALENAMASAKLKAKTIMKTFGRAPERPYKVVESGYYAGVQRSNFALDAVMEKSSVSTPIEAGELTITANVNVEYDY